MKSYESRQFLLRVRGWRLRRRRLGRGWRLRRRLRCSRFRLCSGAGLDWVSLVVKTDYVLRHIDLVGGIKNRRVLRGRIQNNDVAALARVAVQHVDHFAADAVNDVALRRVHVFLILILLALQLPRQKFTLLLQTRGLIWAELPFAGSKALPNVVDLLVEVLQIRLARSKLRLQFRGRQLPFRRCDDGLADVDDTNLS